MKNQIYLKQRIKVSFYFDFLLLNLVPCFNSYSPKPVFC